MKLTIYIPAFSSIRAAWGLLALQAQKSGLPNSLSTMLGSAPWSSNSWTNSGYSGCIAAKHNELSPRF